jgi:hypothetical protein
MAVVAEATKEGQQCEEFLSTIDLLDLHHVHFFSCYNCSAGLHYTSFVDLPYRTIFLLQPFCGFATIAPLFLLQVFSEIFGEARSFLFDFVGESFLLHSNKSENNST